MLQLLWTTTETINKLFVVNFLECIVTDIALFSRNCCFKNTDISLGSVATHLRCGEIFSNSVTTNFFLISTVKKIKNRFTFDKVYWCIKILCHFCPPCICRSLRSTITCTKAIFLCVACLRFRPVDCVDVRNSIDQG